MFGLFSTGYSETLPRESKMFRVLLSSMIRIVLLFCLMSNSAFSAGLTLEECLVKGRADNQEVKAYQLAVKAAEEGIKEAWGGFLPTLSLSYDQSRVFDSRGEGLDADFMDQESERLTARLSQPVFAGFKTVAGLEKARLSKTYTEYELEYILSQLSREISRSFYDILRAEQLVNKWKGSISRLGQQKEIVEAWVDKALAPRIRLLEVDVEVSNARQQLITAQSDLAIARARMKELLALPPGEDFQISGTLDPDIVAPCDSIEGCTTLALEQRADLKLMGLNIEIVRKSATEVLSRNLPQVNLDASWTDYQRDYDNAGLSDDDRDYYSLFLNINFRPFQGGRNLFAWRRQRLELERAQHLKADLHQTIVSEVNARFEQFYQNFGLVQNARDSRAEAWEAYRLVKRSVELGVISLEDLLNAELRLTRSEINQVEAAHKLNSAYVQLEHVLGR